MIGGLVLLFLGVILLGLPIVYALGGLAAIVMVWQDIFNPVTIAHNMYAGLDSFPLLAVPFFMLAGSIMEEAKITKRLMDFAYELVGRFAGGMAHVAILLAMLFAAMCGSAVATAAAIGALLLPTMRERGYDDGFSSALIACGGAIGPIIPPSIPMIIYAVIAGVSVKRMFLGGVVPGIAFGLVLMVYSFFYAKKHNYPRETEALTLKDFWNSFKRAFLALLLPVIILGGIFSGIFTATESAAVAAFYALILGFFVYRTISLKQMPKILLSAAKGTATVMIIVAAASALAWVLTSQQIPQKIATSIMAMTDNSTVVLILLNLLILVLGCFIDAVSIIMLLSPIVLTVITRMGVDPVFFGVLLTVNVCIGALTPPVGTCLFVASKAGNTRLADTCRAVIPMVGLVVMVLLLCILFPGLVLGLPNLAGV